MIKRKLRFLQEPRKITAKRFTTPLGLLTIFRAFTVLLVLSAIFYFIFKTDVFKVSAVSVLFEGYGYDSELIKNRLSSAFMGRNIFWLSEGNVLSALKKEYISIANAKLLRSLPKRVTVYVTQRDPIAVIIPMPYDFQSSPSAAVSLSGKEESSPNPRLLIDRFGLPFYKEAVSDMTVVVTQTENITLGVPLNKPLDQFMINAVSQMKVADVTVSLVVGIQSDVLVVRKDKSFIWLTPTKEISHQVEILKMIIEKYRVEGKSIAKIDLRFKNPVVEFK